MHFLYIHAGELEVLLQGKTLRLHSSCEILHHALNLGVDHGIRDLHGGILYCFLDCLSLFLCSCCFLFLLGQFLLDILFVLSKGLKLGNFACELVICFRKLFYSDCIYFAFEYGFFSCKALLMIVLRESNGNVFLLTDLGANQLILKARDEASGTDGQSIVLSFSALERNTVYGTVKVKFDDVAALNCSVIYIDGSGVVLSLLVNLFVDVLVSYLNVALLNLYAFVLAKGNFRFYSNFCGKDEGFSSFDLTSH